MKKFLAILATVTLLLSFTACNGKKAEEETTNKEPTETTEISKVTEETETNSVMMDFTNISVENYFYAYCGEVTSVPDEIKGADAYCSSKLAVATVSQSGEITPKKRGTTLIGYEKDGVQKAIICCVFGEGEEPSKVAGSPQIFEKGKNFFHTAPASDVQYTSSDSSVVNVENAPNLSFDGCGYAEVCAQSISRPFYYSFIVYDRTVDN